MPLSPTKCFPILVALALSACSVDSMIDRAYPDRERFQVTSDNGIDQYTFLCEVDESASATQARVAEARDFLDANLEAASTIATDQMIADIEEGRSALGTGFRTVTAMDRAAEVIAEETEARFQCLLIDVVETF